MACSGTGSNPAVDNSSDSTSTHAEDCVSATTDTFVYGHEYIVKVGNMAPDFSLPMTDGDTFTLSEQRS